MQPSKKQKVQDTPQKKSAPSSSISFFNLINYTTLAIEEAPFDFSEEKDNYSLSNIFTGVESLTEIKIKEKIQKEFENLISKNGEWRMDNRLLPDLKVVINKSLPTSSMTEFIHSHTCIPDWYFYCEPNENENSIVPLISIEMHSGSEWKKSLCKTVLMAITTLRIQNLMGINVWKNTSYFFPKNGTELKVIKVEVKFDDFKFTSRYTQVLKEYVLPSIKKDLEEICKKVSEARENRNLKTIDEKKLIRLSSSSLSSFSQSSKQGEAYGGGLIIYDENQKKFWKLPSHIDERNKLDHLMTIVEVLKQNITLLHKDVINLETNNEKLESKENDLKNEIKRLETDIQDLETYIEKSTLLELKIRMQTKLKSSTEQLESLRKELESSTKEIENSREKHKISKREFLNKKKKFEELHSCAALPLIVHNGFYEYKLIPTKPLTQKEVSERPWEVLKVITKSLKIIHELLNHAHLDVRLPNILFQTNDQNQVWATFVDFDRSQLKDNKFLISCYNSHMYKGKENWNFENLDWKQLGICLAKVFIITSSSSSSSSLSNSNDFEKILNSFSNIESSIEQYLETENPINEQDKINSKRLYREALFTLIEQGKLYEFNDDETPIQKGPRNLREIIRSNSRNSIFSL